MPFNIVNLTPYLPDVLLRNISEKIRVLELLNFIINSCQKALNSFISSNYINFDAQVSENLCQIRAYQLVQLNELVDKNELIFYLNKMRLIKLNCEKLLNDYHLLSIQRPNNSPALPSKHIALEDFLKENILNISFSEAVFFLTQLYILSHYKLIGGKYEIPYGINYKNLCADLKINSKTFASRFIHRLQRNISRSSVNFILNIALELNQDKQQIELLKALYFKDEIGRHVLPCYEATKVILNHALKRNTYIQIVAAYMSTTTKEAVKFILKPSPNKDHFVLCTNFTETNKSLMIFQGIIHVENEFYKSKSDYIKNFMRIGFENIIFSNMAQHPQYAGILLADKKYNPYQALMGSPNKVQIKDIEQAEHAFLAHKQLSTQIGCSPDNSNLFLLTHVYYSTIAPNYAILNTMNQKEALVF